MASEEMCPDCGRPRMQPFAEAGDGVCLAFWYDCADLMHGPAIRKCTDTCIARLRAELEALKAPPVYPSVVKFVSEETPQGVGQPQPEVFIEVDPGGFAFRIWNHESPRWPFARKVRYVLPEAPAVWVATSERMPELFQHVWFYTKELVVLKGHKGSSFFARERARLSEPFYPDSEVLGWAPVAPPPPPPVLPTPPKETDDADAARAT